MHLFKNCQIQFLILYEHIVWACFIWVNKWQQGLWTDGEFWVLICRLVVTAPETWFTLHYISGLLFQAAGRQLLPLHTCLPLSDSCVSMGDRNQHKQRHTVPTLLRFMHPSCWLQHIQRNRCQVMFSQLESVESVMRECMNVNMIPECSHVV